MKAKVGVGMGISPVVCHEGQGWGWDGRGALPCSLDMKGKVGVGMGERTSPVVCNF
jgi:hypothetical protein